MKVPIHFFGCLVVLLTTVAACHKDKATPPPNRQDSSPPPQGRPPLTGVIHGNTEYFWGYGWTQTSRGQEIQITTIRLTQEAINKGISVHVAPYTEMSTFSELPVTVNGIELSYVAEPTHLYVIARAPFTISDASDVYIEYR
ncbi:MAG: hypothetical protein ICV53_14340 [Flavisolibacter sp.]|nr:hypothetical protein [Flavisolibacter sp.]